MLALLLLLGVIAFVFHKYRNYIKAYEDIDKLPGPSTIKLIRELYFNSSSKGIVSYLLSLTKTYGPVVKVWIKPFRPIIVTCDMEYCNKIYKANDHHMSPIVHEMTFMGEGVATNKSYDIWKNDKKIVVKALTKQYIETKLGTYDKKYDELINVINSNLNKPVNIEKHLHKIILNILIETFQHPRVNISEKELIDFRTSRDAYFELLMEKMNSFKCMGVLHRFTKNYKLMRKRHDEIVEFGRKWLEKYKRVEEDFRDKTNLVYAMMEGGIPDSRIADNINTMIEGGHDTSILPLSMTFREMALQSEIQDKLLKEIHNVIGSDITKQVTLEELNKMPYLHAIVKESVRRFMSIPLLDRRTLYDMAIKGTRIPKGTNVMFDLTSIMTAEENYDEPLVFKPERFLKENVRAKSHRAFVGFGYGAKYCLGKYIAYAAMKLLLVKIVREFEILHVDYDVQLTAEVFLRSSTGIPSMFRKRIVN